MKKTFLYLSISKVQRPEHTPPDMYLFFIAQYTLKKESQINIEMRITHWNNLQKIS